MWSWRILLHFVHFDTKIDAKPYWWLSPKNATRDPHDAACSEISPIYCSRKASGKTLFPTMLYDGSIRSIIWWDNVCQCWLYLTCIRMWWRFLYCYWNVRIHTMILVIATLCYLVVNLSCFLVPHLIVQVSLMNTWYNIFSTRILKIPSVLCHLAREAARSFSFFFDKTIITAVSYVVSIWGFQYLFYHALWCFNEQLDNSWENLQQN